MFVVLNHNQTLNLFSFVYLLDLRFLAFLLNSLAAISLLFKLSKYFSSSKSKYEYVTVLKHPVLTYCSIKASWILTNFQMLFNPFATGHIFVSNLALNLDRSWQMKHCLCLQFPCRVNNLVEKGMLYVQSMDHGRHKNLVFAVVHVLYVQHGVFSHRTVSIFLYTLLVGF